MKNQIEKILKDGFLHHSYIFVGDFSIDDMTSIFENIGINTKANPNLYIYERDLFLIDDVRDVLEKHSRRGFTFNGNDGKNIFLIKLNSITFEAQNAFLKVLEEPNPNTYFFIISPQNIFLPTFLSRVNLVNLIDNKKNKIGFLEKSIVEKLEIVSKICKDISDEKKTKQDAIYFLNTIEEEILEKEGSLKAFNKLKIIENSKEMLLQKGATLKIILEHTILNL